MLPFDTKCDRCGSTFGVQRMDDAEVNCCVICVHRYRAINAFESTHPNVDTTELWDKFFSNKPLPN